MPVAARARSKVSITSVACIVGRSVHAGKVIDPQQKLRRRFGFVESQGPRRQPSNALLASHDLQLIDRGPIHTATQDPSRLAERFDQRPSPEDDARRRTRQMHDVLVVLPRPEIPDGPVRTVPKGPSDERFVGDDHRAGVRVRPVLLEQLGEPEEQRQPEVRVGCLETHSGLHWASSERYRPEDRCGRQKGPMRLLTSGLHPKRSAVTEAPLCT